jgi:uridine kinase
MTFCDDPHEFRFGVGDVGQRLRRLRIGIENYEVNGMTRLQRYADLRVFLEAADAGTVSGAWIDDDERPQRVVDDDIRRWQDPHKRVADWMLERARVGEDFVLVRQ